MTLFWRFNVSHLLALLADDGTGHGLRNLFQSGGAQVHFKKTIENFRGLNLQLCRHKH